MKARVTLGPGTHAITGGLRSRGLPLVVVGLEQPIVGPALVSALVDRSDADARNDGDFARSRQAGDPNCLSLIACLLSTWRPPTILEAVIAVVVVAFERVVGGRAPTHIRNKCLERFIPAVAHANAARAPVFIMRVAFAITAIAHGAPNAILRRFPQTMPPIALACPRTSSCPVQATTAAAVAIHQILTEHENGGAALAPAIPARPSVAISTARQHRQSLEAFAGQIAFKDTSHA